MDNIELISMIRNFPIGDIAIDRSALLSKATIISYLSRFQDEFLEIEAIEERELMVRSLLKDILVLKENEVLPSLTQAESNLKLSSGFMQDFGKIQYIKENNPSFNKTYNIIANHLGLISEVARKTR